jgi:hypothetical protein
LSCKFLVSEGMNVTDMAPELVGCLRTKLGQATQAATQAQAPEPARIIAQEKSGAPGQSAPVSSVLEDTQND